MQENVTPLLNIWIGFSCAGKHVSQEFFFSANQKMSWVYTRRETSTYSNMNHRSHTALQICSIQNFCQNYFSRNITRRYPNILSWKFIHIKNEKSYSVDVGTTAKFSKHSKQCWEYVRIFLLSFASGTSNCFAFYEIT